MKKKGPLLRGLIVLCSKLEFNASSILGVHLLEIMFTKHKGIVHTRMDIICI